MTYFTALLYILTILSSTDACQCGKAYGQGSGYLFKIFSGAKVASASFFPWEGWVQNGHLAKCGAIIIKETYLLSIASCYSTDPNAPTKVCVGSQERISADTRCYTPLKVIIHPGFKKTSEGNRHDLIIYKVAPLPLNNQTEPICLPDKSDRFVGRHGLLAGFGVNNNKPRPGGEAFSYMRADLWETPQAIQDDRKCASFMHKPFYKEDQLCTYSKGQGGCIGDSGSALMVEHLPGRYKLLGVATTRLSCGRSNYADIYERVTYYLPWINENTKDATDCPPYPWEPAIMPEKKTGYDPEKDLRTNYERNPPPVPTEKKHSSLDNWFTNVLIGLGVKNETNRRL